MCLFPFCSSLESEGRKILLIRKEYMQNLLLKGLALVEKMKNCKLIIYHTNGSWKYMSRYKDVVLRIVKHPLAFFYNRNFFLIFIRRRGKRLDSHLILIPMILSGTWLTIFQDTSSLSKIFPTSKWEWDEFLPLKASSLF